MDYKQDQNPAPGASWIVFGPSPIHGIGGFARRRIPAGQRVIEYTGERIDREEALRRCEANNHYIFAVNESENIDGDVVGNSARFINHSCAPNCEAWVEDGRIWIVSCRVIEAGEELTFNYGFDLESYRDYPCKCGAPECVGFIVAEDFFGHVRAMAALRSGCGGDAADCQGKG